MTDNEIIKALRLCAIDSDVCSDACPYYEERDYFDGDCIKQRTLDAIDLINRLKQENAELKQQIENSERESELKWEREIMMEETV